MPVPMRRGRHPRRPVSRFHYSTPEKPVGASIARPQPAEIAAARNDTYALPSFVILSKRSASKDLRTDGTAWVKLARRSLHALRLVGMTRRWCGGGIGVWTPARGVPTKGMKDLRSFRTAVVFGGLRTSDARPYEGGRWKHSAFSIMHSAFSIQYFFSRRCGGR